MKINKMHIKKNANKTNTSGILQVRYKEHGTNTFVSNKKSLTTIKILLVIFTLESLEHSTIASTYNINSSLKAYTSQQNSISPIDEFE